MCLKKCCLWCFSCCCYQNKDEESDQDDIYMDIAEPVSSETTPSLVVQALYDYNTTTWCPEGDIKFKKDERFSLLEQEGQWYIVQTETGQKGRVPSNYVEFVYDKTWYFEDVHSRLEAEILLSNTENPRGAFLIRKAHHSRNHHSHSLSVLKDEDIFHHFRIFWRYKRFYLGQGNMKSYTTLSNLVKDCKEKQYISIPCIRESIPPTIDISEFKDDLIDFNSIKLIKKVGQGRAGEVYRGHWNQRTVAVKKIRDPIELSELKKEAAILKKCIHRNIVIMYGICAKDTLMIVQEYITGGSVQDIMLSKQKELLSKYRTLQYIGYNVARGMAYLERRNYIHCDLAARNVLIGLNQQPFIVKIADFGMARCLASPIYVTPGDRLMPIRWSAPEVLCFGKLSIKSDVWSYGIFLMELFTNCRLPYHNISSNAEVQSKILKGYRMGYPGGFNVTKSDFQVIENCWKLKPLKRPTFASLRQHFENEGSRWEMLDDKDSDDDHDDSDDVCNK